MMVWGIIIGIGMCYGVVELCRYARRRIVNAKARPIEGILIEKKYQPHGLVLSKACNLIIENTDTKDKISISYNRSTCKLKVKDLYDSIKCGDMLEVKCTPASKLSNHKYLGLDAKILSFQKLSNNLY